MTKNCLLFVLLLIAAGAAPAAIHKWVDEEGKIHYSDRPPDQYQSNKIKAAPAPSEEEAQRAKDRTQRLLEAEKHRQEAETKAREENAANEQMREEQEKRCATAKGNLKLLNMQLRVFTVNEQGEQIYLSDEERAARIESTNKQIEQHCR